VACVAVLQLAGGRGGTPDLAARAYAATTGNGVIHWRTEQHNYSDGHDIEHLRIEGWARNGVTHIVRSRVRRGEARLIDDRRTAGGRSKTYIAAADDYISGPGPTSSSANPLAGGDPFAIFRRAYRTGKLKQVGPERYDNRLVMRFTAYERLPFNRTNRAKLSLLAHPQAGPKDDPPADHFAVLGGDRRPGPGALRAIQGLTGQQGQIALDAAGARAITRRPVRDGPVRNHYARLPFSAYQWQFLR
jgi:hypothetical protein